MLRIDQPPHHVLDAIGRLDDADEQVPVAARRAGQDDLGAIVERAIQVVHERLLVHPPFVQRPRRLGPAERPVVAEPLEQLAGEAGRVTRSAPAASSGFQLTGET